MDSIPSSVINSQVQLRNSLATEMIKMNAKSAASIVQVIEEATQNSPKPSASGRVDIRV